MRQIGLKKYEKNHPFRSKNIDEFSKRVKKITPVFMLFDRVKKKKPAPNGRFL